MFYKFVHWKVEYEKNKTVIPKTLWRLWMQPIDIYKVWANEWIVKFRLELKSSFFWCEFKCQTFIFKQHKGTKYIINHYCWHILYKRLGLGQGTLNRGRVDWQMSTCFSCFLLAIGIMKKIFCLYKNNLF